jgi:transposase
VAGDWRDQRIAELEREHAELRRENAELKAKVEQLLKRVAELEERLRQSSRNSSKPPSSDGPATPARKYYKRKQKSGKKRGGQPGHEKHERKLVPPDQVDEHHDCVPKECEDCREKLLGRDPDPELHQVFEIPEVRPRVSQYALHSLGCDRCGHITQGQLPKHVPTRSFGPSVDAVVGLLAGPYRLSKRFVQALIGDLFGLEMSLGSVIDCQRAVSEAVAAPVVEATQFAREQPVKHADETGWFEKGKRAWLWVLATPLVTVFMVHLSRDSVAAQQLLGAAMGILVTDRHAGYNWWPLGLRQVCWAHLLRDFTAISERGGHSEKLGKALLEQAHQMFSWWHRVRDGTLQRSTFRVYMRSVRSEVKTLLIEGRDQCSHPRTARTCSRLLKVFPALWLFVDQEGVEPTNNVAEQRARHPVIWRRTSHGTQSKAGSRFVERILTVYATLRQQNRNVLDFLRAACTARLRGTTAPSLLPTVGSDRSVSLPAAA